MHCTYCGRFIEGAIYKRDGNDFYHFYYPVFDAGVRKPMGREAVPEAMNSTYCNGIDMRISSVIEPSHISGLNVMSMKEVF